jgi:hypothetical protein
VNLDAEVMKVALEAPDFRSAVDLILEMGQWGSHRANKCAWAVVETRFPDCQHEDWQMNNPEGKPTL